MTFLKSHGIHIFLIIIVAALAVSSYIVLGSGTSAFAQEPQITYPIPELGNCANQQECKAYCDIAANYSKCAEFAGKHNLANVPDDKKAVFAAMQNGEGPGGCDGETACRAYCEDIDHIDECLTFIEKFNLSSDELTEIRKVADAKKAGVAFPGNCKTKNSCEAYCQISAHVLECIKFAQKSGVIPKEDVGALEKFIPYIESGGKFPGGCTTKTSCREYCEVKEHVNECADFSLKTGLISKEEAEIMKKTGGESPGDCRSREACDAYCKDEAHIDECIDFAVKAGFISQEDATMAREFGISSGGPGGCKSKAECEAFCVVNQDTCIEWGKEHGIDMGGGPGGQAGPGGCKTKEECTAYCQDHQEECQNFFPPADGGTEYIGPGGCKSKAECEAFCAIPENQDSCSSFVPPGDAPSGGLNASPPPYIGPGGCKSQAECQAFCAVKANQEACASFVPPGGAGGSRSALPPNITGPGDCKNKSECDAFCLIPTNEKVCINFANEQGFKTEGVVSTPEECATRGGNWMGYCDFGGSECAKQGGTWAGNSCEFPKPPLREGEKSAITAEDCVRQGGDWSGNNYCDFGRVVCVEQGGAWDGSTCKFPEGQYQ